MLFKLNCFKMLELLHNGLIRSNLMNNNFCSKTNKYDLNLILRGVPLQNYINSITNNSPKQQETYNNSQTVIQLLNQRKTIISNIENVSELLLDQDTEIKSLANEEKSTFENQINEIDRNILEALLPSDKEDLFNDIVLEVNTGVGGQEAMLFASELFDMYCNYATFKGWSYQIAEYASTEIGGIRRGSILISGSETFRHFKHEAGVHRVQRIPATERAGRIHTSTVSVLALPQPNEIEIRIESKDIKVETKRASGAGGQHVNTTDSAVRIVHLPSGISVDCQVDRSQPKNREIALGKLRALLYEKERDSQVAENLATRKSQVRTNFRNEKIRTYNFPQDRITDHRLQSANIHNLKGFLEGGAALDILINKLDKEYKIESLLRLATCVK